jgi:hypothetical protein
MGSSSASRKDSSLFDANRLLAVEIAAPIRLVTSDEVAEVTAAVATAAGLPAADQLRLVKQEDDDLGYTHYRCAVTAYRFVC